MVGEGGEGGVDVMPYVKVVAMQEGWTDIHHS